MFDTNRIKSALPTNKWGVFVVLGVLVPAALAIGAGETSEEMAFIFGGCFLAALLVLSEFIKDG